MNEYEKSPKHIIGLLTHHYPNSRDWFVQWFRQHDEAVRNPVVVRSPLPREFSDWG